jgi:acyl-CoA reductase-like NAD-dependent aldehyde dehydrogenase
VFGPVLNVEPFERFEDALARANATRFGLQAGVFTRDLARALAAQRELEFGAVIVNDTPTLRLDALAYGGTKDSGVGREGPASALEEYTEPRLCVLRAAP